MSLNLAGIFLWFQVLSISDLPDTEYNSFVSVDNNSCLWVSSSNGISRYCGSELKSYTRFNSGMSGDFVQSKVFEDENSIKYFTTTNQLNFIDDNDTIRTISLTYNDEILKSDYHIFDIDTISQILYFSSDKKLFKVYYNKNYKLELISNSDSRVFSISKDRQTIVGSPWLYSEGLEIFKNVDGNWKCNQYLESICIDGNCRKPIIQQVLLVDDVIYCTSNLGLVLYNLNGELLSNYHFEFLVNNLAASSDKLYISTEGDGVYVLDFESQSIGKDNYISSLIANDSPRELHFINGDLIVSFSGMDPQIFNLNTIITEPNTAFTKIHDMQAIDDIIYVIDKEYLFRWDIESQKIDTLFRNYNGTPFYRIARNDKSILFGSTTKLYSYDLEASTVSDVLLDEEIQIVDLYNLKNDVFLVTNKGCYVYNNELESFVYIQEDWNTGSVDFYFEEENFRIICETNGDVYRLRNDSTLFIRNLGYVFDIDLVESDIYISSSKGFYLLQKNKMTELFSESYKLKGDVIYNFTKEYCGHHYITTNTGLYSIDTSFNILQKLFITSTGRIGKKNIVGLGDRVYVNSITDVISFNPCQINQDIASPVLFTNYVEVDGNSYILKEDNEIILNSDYQSLLFSFGVTDFSGEPKYKMKYLDVESNITYFSRTESIEFSRLSSGSHNYIFSGIGGNLSLSNAINFNITVLPPFHQTWWFRSLAILGLIGIGFFISYLRTRQKLKRQQILIDRQEALQSQRNRMSQDLHDEMGSGLSAIKHLSATQSSRDKDQQIESIATTLIRSMRDLLWSLDESNDTIHNLAVKIRQTANQMLRNSNINHKIAVSLFDNETSISGPIRRNLVLVTKELLNNALKHSQASILDITFTSESERMILQIRDNGIGYDISKAATGYGLKSIEKRLKDIGATSKVVSNDSGTNVKIELPLL